MNFEKWTERFRKKGINHHQLFLMLELRMIYVGVGTNVLWGEVTNTDSPNSLRTPAVLQYQNINILRYGNISLSLKVSKGSRQILRIVVKIVVKIINIVRVSFCPVLLQTQSFKDCWQYCCQDCRLGSLLAQLSFSLAQSFHRFSPDTDTLPKMHFCPLLSSQFQPGSIISYLIQQKGRVHCDKSQCKLSKRWKDGWTIYSFFWWIWISVQWPKAFTKKVTIQFTLIREHFLRSCLTPPPLLLVCPPPESNDYVIYEQPCTHSI